MKLPRDLNRPGSSSLIRTSARFLVGHIHPCDPAIDEHDSFELQPLEPRVLLSAEGLSTAFSADLSLERLWHAPLGQAALVEMIAPDSDSVQASTAASTSTSSRVDDLFAAAVPVSAGTGSRSLDASAIACAAAAQTTNVSASTTSPGGIGGAAAIYATVEAPVLNSHLSVTTLPNGPPLREAGPVPPATPVPPTAAETLALASLFTSALTTLQTQLSTWGSFFNLGSINFSVQGLSTLSLPVVPDSLSSLFDLGSKLGAVTLPSFTSAETKDAFVTQLLAQNFTLRSIEGGFTGGGTTIAASTGTTLLEGSLTLSIATGFAISSGYSGSTYNSATPSVLAGLASSADVTGSLSWTGNLSLTLNFALDSSAGLLLLGDSALKLTVVGSGTMSGSAPIGGASGTSLTGTAAADLTITLGFRDATARYAVNQIGATTLTPLASGTSSLSLAFTTGPVALTYRADYTLSSNTATRAVTQPAVLSLAGTITLTGITTNTGAPATVTLNGAYNATSQTWTIGGTSSVPFVMFGQTVTQVSVVTTIKPDTFGGTFSAQLQTDFLRNGSSPAVVNLSATYDRSAVTVTASATFAALNVDGTGGNRALALTGATLGGTFTGTIAGGMNTDVLTISATSATFQPDQTNYTAVISDGNDADAFGLIGTYDFSAQAFVLTIDQFALLVTGVFRAAASGFMLNYDRTKTDPAQVIAELNAAKIDLLAMQQASSAEPPSITISTLTIRQNGFAFANATATFGDYTLGGNARFGSLVVTLDNISYTTGSAPAGVIGLNAASGTLFPDKAASATLTTISGSFNLVSKAFSLTIGTLDATVDTTLRFTGSGIGYGYDPTAPPTQVIIKADALTAALPSSSVSGTLTGLEVTAAGGFSAVSLSLDSSGFAKTLGFGELLPFEITSLFAKFRGDTNLNGVRDADETFSLTAFDLTVRGYFDFAKLNSLPFTPIIRIGPPGAAQQSFEKATQTFEFTVTVSSAGIKPKDIGPIEIGFSDLKVGGTVTLGGTVILGGYKDGVFLPTFGGTFSLVSKDNVKNVTTSVAAVLVGTFDTAAHTVDGNGSVTVNFSYGTYVDVQGAQLNFTFGLKADSAFSVSVTRLTLTSGTIESVKVVFGTQMIFTATGATLDFSATGKQALATFDLMSVRFPTVLNLRGTATNFGFAADGSLITRPGFAAWIEIDSISLKWPSWLPFRIDGIGLSWPDFSLDPLNFVIILSGSVTSLNGLTGLKVEGTVKNAIIDLRLLAEGKFPLVGLELVAISVSGNMFGGQVSGTLALGLIRLDAAGRQIGATDHTTPVDKRVLYGAIEAGFTFASMSGFVIRIGLSELGPLQVYLSVSKTVIIDASSGLAIKDFRAGVMFNSELSAINDPLQLKNSTFTPAAQLSLGEWLAALETAVVNQARAPPSGNFWSVFARPMRIEGGATLFSAYASTTTFRADVDIIFDTNGKVVINARGVFADKFSFNFRLYTDLATFSTDPTFYFLSEQPQNPTVLTLRGKVQFKVLAKTHFIPELLFIRLVGAADATLSGVGTITLEGTITLKFTASQATLDFDATLKMDLLGNLAKAAGRLVFRPINNGIELWGVARVTPNFNQLESLGLFTSGNALLQINTASHQIVESITLPGESAADFLLKPHSFSVLVTGAMQMKKDGANWFRLEGNLTYELSAAGLDMAVDANLVIGSPNAPIVTFKAAGYFAIRSNGVAARVGLSLVGKLGGEVSKLELEATFQLVFNTTGKTVTYTLPASATPIDGSRTINVSGIAPGATSASPYFCVDIRGSLTFDGKARFFDGTYQLTVAPTSVQLAVSASYELSTFDVRLLSYTVSGEFAIGNDGVHAKLALKQTANVPASQGWSLSGTFELEFDNTMSGPFRSNTLGIYGSGTLGVGGFGITGAVGLTISAGELSIIAKGTLPIKVGNTTVLTFDVGGWLRVDSFGLTASLSVTLASNGAVPAGHGWSLSGTYRLDLNTRSSAVTLGGVTVAANTARVFIDGSVSAAGFELKGTFALTVSPSGVSMAATAKAKLLSVTFDVSGALGIFSDGLAFTLAVNLPELKAGDLFSVKGDFTFAVNTSPAARLGIAAKSGYLAANVQLSLAGVGVSGGIKISSSGRVDITSSSPLTTEVLGQTATVSGYVDFATGNFDLTGKITVNIGNASVAKINGDVGLRLYRTSKDGVIASGLDATLGVALYAFGVKVADLTGTTSANAQGFDLSVKASYTLGGFVSISGDFSVQVSTEYVAVKFSGDFDILGRFKGKLSGYAGTNYLDRHEWYLSGTASASFGGDSLGASMNVNVVLGSGKQTRISPWGRIATTYTPGVTLSGSAWARVSVYGYGFGISADFSASVTGESITVSVSGGINVPIYGRISASKDVHINLRTGSVWLSDVGGATVFFDVNRNGRHDPGEPITQATATGSFTFDPVSANTAVPTITVSDHLGRLLPHDRNGNGVIDADEGVFVLTGGFAVHDGAANTQTLLFGQPEGHAGYRGATIFLDLNGNGQHDDNEPFTRSDDSGFYTFDEPHDFVEVAALGLLARFDLNHNGIIDPEEGMLLVTGGRVLRALPDAGLAVGDSLMTTLQIGTVTTGVTVVAQGQVFLDLNDNGILDAGEPHVTTGADGSYTFDSRSIAQRVNALGRLGAFDTNQNGVIDANEGRLVVVGGDSLGLARQPGDPLYNSDALLNANAPSGVITWRGATVFLDLNGNGRLDDGEVSTSSNAHGFYTFLDASQFNNELGALKPYDRNGNGILDPEEGVFVMTGGVDLHTGLTNQRTLMVLATNYGSIFGTQISPLSELYTYLVLGGLSLEDANRAMHHAFGLPHTVDFLTFDPDEFTGLEDHGEIAAKLVSFLAFAGAEIIDSLSGSRSATGQSAFTHGEAEDFIIHALADYVRRLGPPTSAAVDDNGEHIGGTAALTFHDSAVMHAILADALARAGLALPPAAQFDAAIAALDHFLDGVVAMREANLTDITGALARMSAAVHAAFHEALDELFDGVLTVAQFNQRFTADAVRQLIRSIEIPKTNAAPTVSFTGTADTTRPDIAAGTPVAVPVLIADSDNLPSHVDLRIESSNPALVPSANVTIAGTGGNRTLLVSPILGRTGTATLTIHASDGQNLGGPETVQHFTVTIVYTFAQLMNDLAIRARHSADDAASAIEREAADAVMAASTSGWLAEFLPATGAGEFMLLAPPPPSPLIAATSLGALETPRPMRGL